MVCLCVMCILYTYVYICIHGKTPLHKIHANTYIYIYMLSCKMLPSSTVGLHPLPIHLKALSQCVSLHCP